MTQLMAAGFGGNAAHEFAGATSGTRFCPCVSGCGVSHLSAAASS